MHVFKSFARDRNGSTAMLFGLLAVPTMIAAGAALAYSTSTSSRANLQRAVDAASLAGALLPLGANDSDRVAAAQNVFTSTLRENSAVHGAAATFVVKAGANAPVVNGSATATVRSPFGSLIGDVAVGASSAATKAVSPPICAYALNTFDSGAISLNGTTRVKMDCPVQANSSDRSAVTAVGTVEMTTSVLTVTGDAKGKNAFTPAPVTGSAPVPDPLASLPFPTPGPCAPLSGSTIQDDTTLDPGTYCGGLTISGANVRLMPGIYIFTGGDFKISGNQAVVTGDQVMLGFQDAKFWLADGTMTLTSPLSGTYANIQFMEDRNTPAHNAWVSIGGNSVLDYNGTMYFPNQNIWIFGDATVRGRSPDTIMLGGELWFQGNATVTLTQVNDRGLALQDRPRVRYGAVLVR